jgi:hypothetical protein
MRGEMGDFVDKTAACGKPRPNTDRCGMVKNPELSAPVFWLPTKKEFVGSCPRISGMPGAYV